MGRGCGYGFRMGDCDGLDTLVTLPPLSAPPSTSPQPRSHRSTTLHPHPTPSLHPPLPHPRSHRNTTLRPRPHPPPFVIHSLTPTTPAAILAQRSTPTSVPDPIRRHSPFTPSSPLPPQPFWHIAPPPLRFLTPSAAICRPPAPTPPTAGDHGPPQGRRFKSRGRRRGPWGPSRERQVRGGGL